jgi:uroporphyrinogen decarboxylase
LEETGEYIIFTTEWGVTLKHLKAEDSTPEFLDFTVTDSTVWQDTKKRMAMDEARLNLAHLNAVYPKWVSEGRWIEADFWFGFDVAHSWMSGTETILVALVEEPEWVTDIINTYLDACIEYFDALWAQGFRFDGIAWPDDMGYKGTTFFSPEMYRNIVKPAHKRAVEWAHNKGIVARLHSCGDIRAFLPDIFDTGIDILNPIERKAGMDVLALKKDYGQKHTFHGGIDAVLWDKKEEVLAEIKRLVPELKEGGGYIFASDHSIPNSVSLENMREIFETVKAVGAY